MFVVWAVYVLQFVICSLHFQHLTVEAGTYLSSKKDTMTTVVIESVSWNNMLRYVSTTTEPILQQVVGKPATKGDHNRFQRKLAVMKLVIASLLNQPVGGWNRLWCPMYYTNVSFFKRSWIDTRPML